MRNFVSHILLVSGFLLLMGCAPEVITEVYIKQVPVIVYEEIIVIEQVIEKTVIYEDCREFADEAELKGWLEDNPVSDRRIFKPLDYDCDDFAVDLFKDSIKDGYIMGLYAEGSHMTNFTLIDGKCYEIEPQTDEFVLLGYID